MKHSYSRCDFTATTMRREGKENPMAQYVGQELEVVLLALTGESPSGLDITVTMEEILVAMEECDFAGRMADIVHQLAEMRTDLVYPHGTLVMDANGYVWQREYRRGWMTFGQYLAKATSAMAFPLSTVKITPETDKSGTDEEK